MQFSVLPNFKKWRAEPENLIAAESRIRDADMAREIMALARYSILQQVTMAMLVHANRQAKSVLWLLMQHDNYY
ncbi:flagellin [Desulfallas thermosapovorans]|uniref:Flagellin n=1 Tax=Desulfallas thermosapovorans DSM 6562 TaxID=1121431 RepID=A0A5S4ZRG6_9FIRM|nr:flagellin [Desulfallas thermosapovorans]TYO95497.1 flagellin [Desulfallas thermosapovorans DSM 6562]